MCAKNLKFVVVGDGGIGKTSLLVTVSTGVFPCDHIPTLFDTESGKSNLGLYGIALSSSHVWVLIPGALNCCPPKYDALDQWIINMIFWTSGPFGS